MKNKTKKFHKTAKDYKARNLAISSSCIACAALGLFIPLANQYEKENVMLTQQIEVLLNDDLQIVDENEDVLEDVVKEKLLRYEEYKQF